MVFIHLVEIVEIHMFEAIAGTMIALAVYDAGNSFIEWLNEEDEDKKAKENLHLADHPMHKHRKFKDLN